MIDTQYTLGGVPVILVPSSHLVGSGLCGTQLLATAKAGGKAASLASFARPALSLSITHIALLWTVLVFCTFFSYN